MCEMLGDPVIEDDMPYEIDDFPLEVQQALEVYALLRDEWDTMNGNYLGKNMVGIKDILEVVEIEREESPFIIRLVRLFDKLRSDIINKKAEKPASS